jgi:hypothetical protein
VEHAVERLVGISFLVIALSHILRPREWGQFFDQLRAKGAPGAFINGMLALSLGALIVGFHGTQWSGWAGIVTFVGWAQVFKGMLHLCFPAYSLRSMSMVSADRHQKLVWAGALMLPASIAMLYASAV